MRTRMKFMILPVWALLLVACSSDKDRSAKPDMTVKVATVSSRAVDKQEEFPFIAKPYRSSQLSFRVSGPLERFEVFSGNFYKKGAVIAQIDPRDFRIRKERAEAIYNQARAEFDRVEVLYQKNNLSASAYEKAKADYTSARMAFETATNELNDTRLIAPFDGYVGDVFMEQYQDVKATQPVLTFVDIDRLRIEAFVPQQVAAAARNLKNTDLVFDALPGQVFASQVIEVSKSTTPNNLSYLLTAYVPNKDGRLLAGMSGKVVFRADSRDEVSFATVLPQTALCHRPTVGDYVWVIDPGTSRASRRIIKTGDLLPDGTIEVHEGIKTGEVVAISGLRFLSDDKAVNIVAAPLTPAISAHNTNQ